MNYGYTIPDAFLQGNSIHFRNWQSKLNDDKTCLDCEEKHGKIYSISLYPISPPTHIVDV